jgi:hypothetical protein
MELAVAPYLLVFFLLTALAVLSELRLTKSARVTLLICGYLLVVLLIGLRWQTGTDWSNYHDYYLHTNQIHGPSDSFEIGFQLINVALKTIDLSYSGFLLTYTAIYLGIMILCFEEDSYNMAGWLLLLFYSSFLVAWMGTSRQIMAVGICLYSIRFILGGKWAKFVICVLLAACFHITALCFLIAWPAARINLTLRATWLLFGLTALAVMLHLGTFIVHAAGNGLGIPYLDRMLAAYADPNDQQFITYVDSPGLTALFYLKRLLFLLFFTLCFGLFKSERDKFFFKLYFISAIIFVLFFEVIPMIPLRAGMYFGISELFLMAILTRKIQQPIWRTLYCIGLVILCLARFYTDLDGRTGNLFVPYKAIIYNQDVYRNN